MPFFFPPPPQFTGGRQPYADRGVLPPSISAVAVNDPPFSTRQRAAMLSIVQMWQPPPPQPHIGGRQPLDPRKLPPSITAVRVDNPPPRQGGRTDWQIYMSYAPFPPLPTLGQRSIQPILPLQRKYIIVIT